MALRKKSEQRKSVRGQSDVENPENTKSPNAKSPTAKQKIRILILIMKLKT